MVNKWIEKIIPENFYDTKFTCSPIAPNSVLYPWTIIVNAVWLFSFVGFFWWYADPSMYITQSVIQKEHIKTGFVCNPLNFDVFYDSALGYEECGFMLRAPTADTVILTDDVYSFIPFDPRLVKQSTGKGVEKSIYDPVGGGTSMNDLAELAAQNAADFEAAMNEFVDAGDVSFDSANPFAGNDEFEGGFGGNYGDFDSGADPDSGFGGGNYGDNDGGAVPAPGDSGGNYGDNDGGVDPAPGDSGGNYGDNDGGVDPAPVFGVRRRRLLQEDVNAEYKGLAELSGCNCTMIVTYTGDGAEKKAEELKFNKIAKGRNCVAKTDGEACEMNKARAVLMYRQFLANTDSCEFVIRNRPFQCTREEASPLAQRLSLAYANSGLLYSVVAALAVNYMYATKKVTIESVDIEQLQKMASMNQISVEEPAK